MRPGRVQQAYRRSNDQEQLPPHRAAVTFSVAPQVVISKQPADPDFVWHDGGTLTPTLEQRSQERQGARTLARQSAYFDHGSSGGGAGDQTIMDIAGHVSRHMLKHYSHIRMQAKRNALEAIVKKPADTVAVGQVSGNAQRSPTA
jgi:hypothetical protein